MLFFKKNDNYYYEKEEQNDNSQKIDALQYAYMAEYTRNQGSAVGIITNAFGK